MKERELVEYARRKISEHDHDFNYAFDYFILSLDKYWGHLFIAIKDLDYEKVLWLLKSRNMILKYAPIKEK